MIDLPVQTALSVQPRRRVMQRPNSNAPWNMEDFLYPGRETEKTFTFDRH